MPAQALSLPRQGIQYGCFTLLALLLVDAGSTNHRVTSGSLQTCQVTGEGLLSTQCSSKLVIDTTVHNGLNDTIPVSLGIASVEDCSEDPCKHTYVHNAVTITLTRTPVYFKYPTSYLTTFNYEQYELSVRDFVVVHCDSPTQSKL